jgi:hypothetical protein
VSNVCPDGYTTRVEGPQGQLCAGLADGLSRYDSYRRANTDFVSPTQVAPITLSANAQLQFTRQRRTDKYFVDTPTLHPFRRILIDHLILVNDKFARFGMYHGASSHAPHNALS